MGKTTTYIIIMTGLMLLFYFGGLIQDCGDDGLCVATTPNSLILQFVMNPQDMQESTLAAKIITAILLVGAIAGIALGFATKNTELIAVSPVAYFMLTLGFDFLVVFEKVRDVRPEIAILLFGPVLALYVITILEWWRGRD